MVCALRFRRIALLAPLAWLMGLLAFWRCEQRLHEALLFALVGGFSPGQGEKYVMNGTIRGGYIWNPMTAGEIFVQVAAMLVAGKPIVDGMELTGVGAVRVYPDKRLIQAQKLEALDKDNIKRLVALGL